MVTSSRMLKYFDQRNHGIQISTDLQKSAYIKAGKYRVSVVVESSDAAEKQHETFKLNYCYC